MDEKYVIKHFDFIVENVSDPRGFSINNTIFDLFNPKTSKEREDFLDLCDEIKSFGVDNGYFKIIGKPANNNGYFKLTEKGLELRKYGKGHKKFDKKLSTKPLDWYKTIGLIFTFVFGCSTFYFANKNYNLNLNKLDLEKENVDLVHQLDSCNTKLNRSSNIQIGDNKSSSQTTAKTEKQDDEKN